MFWGITRWMYIGPMVNRCKIVFQRTFYGCDPVVVSRGPELWYILTKKTRKITKLKKNGDFRFFFVCMVDPFTQYVCQIDAQQCFRGSPIVLTLRWSPGDQNCGIF